MKLIDFGTSITFQAEKKTRILDSQYIYHGDQVDWCDVIQLGKDDIEILRRRFYGPCAFQGAFNFALQMVPTSVWIELNDNADIRPFYGHEEIGKSLYESVEWEIDDYIL